MFLYIAYVKGPKRSIQYTKQSVQTTATNILVKKNHYEPLRIRLTGRWSRYPIPTLDIARKNRNSPLLL